MDPLSILGAAAASLQIVEFISKLGLRILEKRKDSKSLKEIVRDIKKYIVYIEKWEGEMEGEAKVACQELRRMLKEVMEEIEGRGAAKKTFSAVALRFHAPEYQAKLNNAFQEFQFRMCIEGRKQSTDADKSLAELTVKLNELHITTKRLKESKFGHKILR